MQLAAGSFKNLSQLCEYFQDIEVDTQVPADRSSLQCKINNVNE